VSGRPLTRLDLVVNIRFPGDRAHGIQVAAMAEALADTGLAVDVVVPRRIPWRDIDPWTHGDDAQLPFCRIQLGP